jgi:hypothetical protein
MRLKSWIAAVALVLISALPVSAGSMLLTGVGPPPSVAATYQGPGDADSGWSGWYSCARAYSAAYAAGAANLCDLVDSAAPTVVICTLKANSSTGRVDLASATCTGGVTPATKCAAATGGTCSISKAYDHLATVGDCTNTTAASQPRLTFSAINGLPSMTFTNAAGSVLTCPSVTQAQPFSMSAVLIRTAVTSTSFIASISGDTGIGGDASGFSRVAAGVAINQAWTENAFHALQGLLNNNSSASNLDGADLAAQVGGTNTMASALRLGRSGSGLSVDGKLMEAGFKPSATTPTTRGNLNTNQHGANGYNF